MNDPQRASGWLLQWRFVLAMLAVAVVACTSPIPQPGPAAEASSPGINESYYREAAARGIAIFRVDPTRSLAVIEVYRAGSLARLGHDHVVASHDVTGFIAPSEGRSDLRVPLQRLVVDEPNLRAEAGFDTRPSADDIEGTRKNMLKVLRADAHPFAIVSVTSVSTDRRAHATITLTGVTRPIEVPATIEASGDAFAASGRFVLRQTDFGIVPLSVLGGALQVRDDIAIRFVIRARRVPDAS
jgi:hypothetical protein